MFDFVGVGLGWPYLLWAAAAYLIGSVSIGDMVARAARFPIRSVGTGNPGTANIFREMGARYAIVVLLLDVLKGWVAMLPTFLSDVPIWGGAVGAAGVLTGHYLPIFWNFKGGTGMVVAIGACFGLSPLGGLAGVPAGLTALGLSRNAALSGAMFFMVAGAVGWWHSTSVEVAVLVAIAAASVAVKSVVQCGWQSSTDRHEG